MAKHNKLGKKGELLAQNYLIEKGFEISEKNWRKFRFEIDIIAIHNNELVLVEVKTRSTNYFGKPIEAIGLKKQNSMIEAANLYAEQINWEGEIRFDVIGVTLNKNITFEHIEDAFST